MHDVPASSELLGSPSAQPHARHLEQLEEVGRGCRVEDLYLWPRSEMGYDLQARRRRELGITDYDIQHKRSRPAQIVRAIRWLLSAGCVEPHCSILDIACGDAVILWQVKNLFPDTHCYGVDCHAGGFGTHEQIRRDGVRLYRVFIQHLFRSDLELPFDLVFMLNSYRGWESADLRAHEYQLPAEADAWLKKNARYVVLTVTATQAKQLQGGGMALRTIGRGEGNSTMICGSYSRLPRPPGYLLWRGW